LRKSLGLRDVPLTAQTRGSQVALTNGVGPTRDSRSLGNPALSAHRLSSGLSSISSLIHVSPTTARSGVSSECCHILPAFTGCPAKPSLRPSPRGRAKPFGIHCQCRRATLHRHGRITKRHQWCCCFSQTTRFVSKESMVEWLRVHAPTPSIGPAGRGTARRLWRAAVPRERLGCDRGD